MFNIPIEITYLTAALSVVVSIMFFVSSGQTTGRKFFVSIHAALPVAVAIVMPLVSKTASDVVVSINFVITLGLYATAVVSFFYCLATFDGRKSLHFLHVIPIFFAFHTAPLVILVVACGAGGCH